MTRKVILFGKGTLAIRIAEWFANSEDHHLRYVVPVVPEPAWTDSLIQWCLANNVPYVPSGSYRDIPGVDAGDWSIDLGFSVSYETIFPPWFINKVRRFLNLHNGPLPKYRGIAPINWALKNEERTHGVTIHEIRPSIDGGPIIAQIRYSIYPQRDEVIDVYNRALAYGYTLFEQTMPILDRIRAEPQEEAEATYYCKEDRQWLGERSDFTRAMSTLTAVAAL